MPRKGPAVPIPGRGARLRTEIEDAHALDASQKVILEEACRCADRLDQLDAIIAGKGVLQLLHFRNMLDGDEDERHIAVTIDAVLSEARQQQTVFKQLLAALRLPDEATGKKPQQRGGARGAYKPGTVTSMDRARARSGA